MPILLGHVPQNTSVGSSGKASGEPTLWGGCSAPNAALSDTVSEYGALACLQPALEVRVAQVMSCFSTLGCASAPHLLVDIQSWTQLTPPSPGSHYSPGTGTDFLLQLQRSPFLCQHLLVLRFAHKNAVLIAWLNLSFILVCDPAPLTFSSFSMLVCLQHFPWPSCHFHLLLAPAEAELLWGQLCWMGTSGASGS